jgi:hypothetical protein
MKQNNGAGRILLAFLSEIKAMTAGAARQPDRETGGDLFGYWTHSGSAVVHYVLGPGPNARGDETSFFQDAEYLEEEGKRLNETYGLQHVGEWHSHHRLALDHPSDGDVSTVQHALRRYRFERFALVIANLPGADKLRVVPGSAMPAPVVLNGYLFEVDHPDDYEPSHWVVLPVDSPVRQAEERIRQPLPVRAEHSPAPEWVLRPGQLTMDELRRTSRSEKPLAGLGDYWYASEEGQRLLRAEHKALEELGVPASIKLTWKNRIRIVIDADWGGVSYLLPHRFPEKPPKVVAWDERRCTTKVSLRDDCGLHWNRCMTLARMHREVLKQFQRILESR